MRIFSLTSGFISHKFTSMTRTQLWVLRFHEISLHHAKGINGYDSHWWSSSGLEGLQVHRYESVTHISPPKTSRKVCGWPSGIKRMLDVNSNLRYIESSLGIHELLSWRWTITCGLLEYSYCCSSRTSFNVKVGAYLLIWLILSILIRASMASSQGYIVQCTPSSKYHLIRHARPDHNSDIITTSPV